MLNVANNPFVKSVVMLNVVAPYRQWRNKKVFVTLTLGGRAPPRTGTWQPEKSCRTFRESETERRRRCCRTQKLRQHIHRNFSAGGKRIRITQTSSPITWPSANFIKLSASITHITHRIVGFLQADCLNRENQSGLRYKRFNGRNKYRFLL